MAAVRRFRSIGAPTCEQVYSKPRGGVHSNDEDPTRLDAPIAHVEAVVALDSDRIGIDGSRHQVTVDIVRRSMERQTPRDTVYAGAKRYGCHELGSDERIMLGIETMLALSVIERIARVQRTHRQLDTTQRHRNREEHSTWRRLGIKMPDNIAGSHRDRVHAGARAYNDLRLARNKIEASHVPPPGHLGAPCRRHRAISTCVHLVQNHQRLSSHLQETRRRLRHDPNV